MLRSQRNLPALVLLLALALSSCRSTPEVRVDQGKLIVTGIDERISCFEISVKRQGVTEFGSPIDAQVTGGQSTITLGASAAVPITDIRISINPECTQQGAPAGEWFYRGTPITLPPAGEVPVRWNEFGQ